MGWKPKMSSVDPHSSQIASSFFDKAQGRGLFVEPTPVEAHWQMGQVENNARCQRQMGYKILEDIDVLEGDFQTLLDELPRQWVFGLNPRVPGHMLEENSDLPNLDPEGRF